MIKQGERLICRTSVVDAQAAECQTIEGLRSGGLTNLEVQSVRVG